MRHLHALMVYSDPIKNPNAENRKQSDSVPGDPALVMKEVLALEYNPTEK